MVKARATKRFADKLNGFEVIEVGEEIEVTEERFTELVSSPLGVFVERIGDKEDDGVNFESMTKARIVEYAKGQGIELAMEMTKSEMIETLGAGLSG